MIMTTAQVVQQLKEKFEGAILDEIVFKGETTVEVHKEELKDILGFLKAGVDSKYDVLMDLTAVDYLFPIKRTQIHYFLHNPTSLERIRIIVSIERSERIPSVADLWRGANWFERELFDMFGVHFEGHPDLSRILMPDDWRGHPMLRDYALTEEPVQFKHDVKPKVPSQIISYDKSRQRVS